MWTFSLCIFSRKTKLVEAMLTSICSHRMLKILLHIMSAGDLYAGDLEIVCRRFICRRFIVCRRYCMQKILYAGRFWNYMQQNILYNMIDWYYSRIFERLFQCCGRNCITLCFEYLMFYLKILNYIFYLNYVLNYHTLPAR